MARSNNSRKGVTNTHGKRHSHCRERGCPYCAKNLIHVERKQRQKGKDE